MKKQISWPRAPQAAQSPPPCSPREWRPALFAVRRGRPGRWQGAAPSSRHASPRIGDAIVSPSEGWALAPSPAGPISASAFAHDERWRQLVVRCPVPPAGPGGAPAAPAQSALRRPGRRMDLSSLPGQAKVQAWSTHDGGAHWLQLSILSISAQETAPRRRATSESSLSDDELHGPLQRRTGTPSPTTLCDRDLPLSCAMRVCPNHPINIGATVGPLLNTFLTRANVNQQKA